MPFYAILRSIPHKLGGVVAIGGALVGLMFLPFINSSEIRSTAFRPLFQKFFWLFVVNCLLLGWIGQNVVEYPYVEIGQFCTFFYFFFLFVLSLFVLFCFVLFFSHLQRSSASRRAWVARFTLSATYATSPIPRASCVR